MRAIAALLSILLSFTAAGAEPAPLSKEATAGIGFILKLNGTSYKFCPARLSELGADLLVDEDAQRTEIFLTYMEQPAQGYLERVREYTIGSTFFIERSPTAKFKKFASGYTEDGCPYYTGAYYSNIRYQRATINRRDPSVKILHLVATTKMTWITRLMAQAWNISPDDTDREFRILVKEDAAGTLVPITWDFFAGRWVSERVPTIFDLVTKNGLDAIN